MTKKITLIVNGSRFDIDVDVTFSKYLEKAMAKDLNIDGNNSFKTLLQAYVRKNYELYEQEKEMDTLLKKLSNSMK